MGEPSRPFSPRPERTRSGAYSRKFFQRQATPARWPAPPGVIVVLRRSSAPRRALAVGEAIAGPAAAAAASAGLLNEGIGFCPGGSMVRALGPVAVARNRPGKGKAGLDRAGQADH